MPDPKPTAVRARRVAGPSLLTESVGRLQGSQSTKVYERVIHRTTTRAADLERPAGEGRRPHEGRGRQGVEDASLIAQGALAEAWGLTT